MVTAIKNYVDPFMLGKEVVGDYDLGAALSGWLAGDRSKSSREWAVSDHILNRTHTHLPVPGEIAIPLGAVAGLMKLNTQVLGTGNAAAARSEDRGMFIRSDVGDPFDVLDLLTPMPSGPGDARLIPVDVPAPAMVGEPGDAGYSKTGDATATETVLAPKLLVDELKFSRVSDVSAPELLGNSIAVAMQKFREVMNAQVAAGSGTGNEVLGAYSLTGVTSSANLTALSGLNRGLVDSALAAGFGFPNASKRLVFSPR